MAMCIKPQYLPSRGIAVPCGQCGFCLKNNKQDWQFRISVEMKKAETAYFVTLTYSDEYVPIQPGTGTEILDIHDAQNFLKRLRYYHSLHKETQIRYFLVGEYGTQFLRPHYHVILFNAYPVDIDKAWPCGYIKIEKLNMANAGYVVGYVTSTDNLSVSRGVPKQFRTMSRRPAIGYDYIRTHGNWHSSGLRNYSKVNGITGRLPRYYKKKMFSKLQADIITQNALQSYDDYYLNQRKHYSSLGCHDPDQKIKELLEFNNQIILSNINEKMKQI